MKNEKDLFYEIENVLHTHEDAYVDGAWEEFIKKKKRRRGIVYIRMIAAAAILLFLGYAAWLFVPFTPVDTQNHQTKNITKPPSIYPKNNEGHDSAVTNGVVVPQKNNSDDLAVPVPLAATKQPAVNEPVVRPKVIEETVPAIKKAEEAKRPPGTINIAEVTKPKTDSTAVASTIKPPAIQPSNNTNKQPVVDKDVSPVVKTEPRRYDRGAQRLNYDSLANLSKPKPSVADEKKSKNLSYAVMVSPSVGNQKMNFGTGVEIAYNINKNFSVSSGITYAYVNAGSNRTPGSAEAKQNYSLQGYNTLASTNSATFSPLSSQSVKDVKLALSGLEIPLNFQYKTKGGFYLSAGLSAMSVIGNDLSYNYLNSRAVSTPSANGLANTISVVTEESTAKSNEKLTGYVGFYTFSAGKKLNFGKGKLHFAPFIKVPFTRVSSENIQLIHGGVQLGFGF
nr:hypothetical protein [uncultured Mucilaginibacter sp.]